MHAATKTGLFVLAFISAVLNYAGFIQIIDSNDWWLKALCLLTAVGVWICLYLFWRYAFSIIPQLRMPTKRLGGWTTIIAGCAVIIALSTYWNVIAYTGKEVLRLSMAENVTRAERQFADTLSQTGGFKTLIPQLEALSVSASNLADGEEFQGAITGSSGKGGITQVLRQIASNVDTIAAKLRSRVRNSEAIKQEGKACLDDMRTETQGGFSGQAAKGLAKGVDCLNAVMADLGNHDDPGSLAASMNGLSGGIIIPVSIKTDRQRQALKNILAGIQMQANTIANAAIAIPRIAIKPVNLHRPNMATAVLLHWHGIIPAIATALAIDLLPLLLLILGVILYRDREQVQKPRHLWTADELADAQRQLDDIRSGRQQHLLTYQPSTKKGDWWDIPSADWENEE